MYLIRQILIIFCPLLVLGVFEFVRVRPQSYWQMLFFLTSFIFFTVWLLCRRKFDKTFWRFLIVPLIWVISGFLFVSFLLELASFYLYSLVIFFFLVLLLRQYNIYFYFPTKYQAYSLESLTFYLVILSIFLLSSTAFASLSLVQLRWSIMLPGLFVFFALLISQFFWMQKVDYAKSKYYIYPIVIILLQVLVAFSYLPTGYFVSAFVLTVLAYGMLNLAKLDLQGGLSKKKILTTLIIGVILLLLVLLTARWS